VEAFLFGGDTAPGHEPKDKPLDLDQRRATGQPKIVTAHPQKSSSRLLYAAISTAPDTCWDSSPLEEAEMTSPSVEADREFREMWRDLLLYTAAFTLFLVVMLAYQAW
jgi:hypothetical protein